MPRLFLQELSTFAWAIGLAACAQAQVASNVGGDGLERGAATIALEGIEPSACSEVAGPRGPVLLTAVFAPDGSVVDAKVEPRTGDNVAASAIAASPRGSCLLERLRALHVSAFKGKPTTVSRKLTLE